MKVQSRSHGKDARRHFYGCAWYHQRGAAVCASRAIVPIEDADAIVLEALLDDVLDARLLEDAVDEALRLVQVDDTASRIDALDAEIRQVEQECSRLVAAITADGELSGLVSALRTCEDHRKGLEASGANCARGDAPRRWTQPVRDGS